MFNEETGSFPIKPLFAFLDERGDIDFEWQFGPQGFQGPGGWSLLLSISADEGTYLIETREHEQNIYYNEEVCPAFIRLMEEAWEQGEI